MPNRLLSSNNTLVILEAIDELQRNCGSLSLIARFFLPKALKKTLAAYQSGSNGQVQQALDVYQSIHNTWLIQKIFFSLFSSALVKFRDSPFAQLMAKLQRENQLTGCVTEATFNAELAQDLTTHPVTPVDEIAVNAETISFIPNSNGKEPMLDWRTRPPVIKKAIEDAFNVIVQRANGWMFNGKNKTYDLGSISEYKLIKSLILSTPKQKEFYVLDIGAGEFGVNSNLFSRLNSDPDVPKNIKIHLIGIRGEPLSYSPKFESISPEIQKREEGICIQYNIGRFQIENMCDEFANLCHKKHFPREMKFDFMVSSFTFIHLIDPIGTMLQAYDLLRPTGYFLTDGFYYAVPKEETESYGPGLIPMHENTDKGCQDKWHLYELLYPLKHIPYLLNFESQVGSIHSFLIRKPNENPLALELKYDGIATQPCEYTSRLPIVMASFEREPSPLEKGMNIHVGYYTSTGNKNLYDDLVHNNIFEKEAPDYYPLQLIFNGGDPVETHQVLTSFSPDTLDGAAFKNTEARSTFFYKNRHHSPYLQHRYDQESGIVPYVRK